MCVAESMPEGYYNRIEGTQDSVLKATLKTIIRNHTVYEYGSGKGATWEIFYYADQDENGYCMDMYCDSWKKFTSVGTAVSGCNIEHSFAKSWWGGDKNDAYKDCYHLNPSNSTANSSRSNYPLGVPTKDIIDQSKTGSLTVGKATYEERHSGYLSRRTNTKAILPVRTSIWRHVTGTTSTAIPMWYAASTKVGDWTTHRWGASSPCATTRISSSGIGRYRYYCSGTAKILCHKRNLTEWMP